MLPHNRPAEAPTLDVYLKALARRPWLVALCLAGVLALALLFLSLRSTTYTASSRVLVGPTPYASTRPNQLVEPNLEREREVLTSLEVAQTVRDRLGTKAEAPLLLADLTVEFQPDTDTIRVAYTDPDPERAALMADAFAQAYVDLRQAQAAGYYRSQIAAVDARLADLREGLVALGTEIDTLTQQRAALSAAGAAGNEITGIDTALLTLRSEQGQFNNEQRELLTMRSALLAEESLRVPAARQLSTARPPANPNGMGATTVLTLALIAGLGLGVAAAFVADRLDTRTRDRFELERSLGTPTLASVPSLGLRTRLSGHSLVMTSDRSSVTAHMAREAFRRLRSSLQFIQTRQDVSLFLVTSANPAEGKSTVVANTAVAIATAGRSVAVVSADLRKPRIDGLFGLESAPGLSEYLDGDDNVDLAHSGVDGLAILPAGRYSAHSSELLGSQRMKQLLVSLQELFDIVLVDTPPVLATADAGTLAAFGGAVVIVVDAKNTSLDDLALVRTELDRVGAVVLGSVLNRDPAQSRGRLRLRRRKGYYAPNAAVAAPADAEAAEA